MYFFPFSTLLHLKSIDDRLDEAPLPEIQDSSSFFFKRFYLFIFREKGREEKEREKNINVWLLLMCPLVGTWPATQACVLTGN